MADMSFQDVARLLLTLKLEGIMKAQVVYSLREERGFLEQILQIKYTFFVLFKPLVNLSNDVDEDVEMFNSLSVHMLHDHTNQVFITVRLDIMMNEGEYYRQRELSLFCEFLFCKISDILIE